MGGTITLGERNYKVIGVLEEQGSSLSGSDDSRILIPYTTAQRATGQKGVGSFYVKASSEGTVSLAMNTVEAYLLQVTRDEDAYSVSNQSQVLDTMDEVDNTMSLLLGGIAAISLLVGGIGIMNIMLVSVTERTREIGIRKAVGAKRRHILLQFLCESCILSLLGGAVGLALSFGGHPVLRGYRHPVRQLPGGESLPAPAHRGPAHPVTHRKTAKPWGAPQGISLFIILPRSGSCPPPGPGR